MFDKLTPGSYISCIKKNKTAIERLKLSLAIFFFFLVSGKLTLKIPWKNLYTESVVASIDGLYALAVPNVGEFCTMHIFSKCGSLHWIFC